MCSKSELRLGAIEGGAAAAAGARAPITHVEVGVADGHVLGEGHSRGGGVKAAKS